MKKYNFGLSLQKKIYVLVKEHKFKNNCVLKTKLNYYHAAQLKTILTFLNLILELKEHMQLKIQLIFFGFDKMTIIFLQASHQ